MCAATVLLCLAEHSPQNIAVVSEKQLCRDYFLLCFIVVTLSNFYSAVLVVGDFKNKATPSLSTPCI
jgi:hypothetical protein